MLNDDDARASHTRGERVAEPELSSREFRMLERLGAHVHYTTRPRVAGRPAVRQANKAARPIFMVRLRRLERAGLIQTARVHGRLAIVPTAAGLNLIAERHERSRSRAAKASDEPVKWWL